MNASVRAHAKHEHTASWILTGGNIGGVAACRTGGWNREADGGRTRLALTSGCFLDYVFAIEGTFVAVCGFFLVSFFCDL